MKGFSVGLHQHGNRSHSPCTDHNQSDKSNFEILFYSFIPMVYGMENGKFFVRQLEIVKKRKVRKLIEVSEVGRSLSGIWNLRCD